VPIVNKKQGIHAKKSNPQPKPTPTGLSSAYYQVYDLQTDCQEIEISYGPNVCSFQFRNYAELVAVTRKGPD